VSLLRRQPLLLIGLIYFGRGPLFGLLGAFLFEVAVQGTPGPALDLVLLLLAYAAGALPAGLLAVLTYALFTGRGSIPLLPLLLAGGILSIFNLMFLNFLVPPIDLAFVPAIGNFLAMHLTAVLGCWAILRQLAGPR